MPFITAVTRLHKPGLDKALAEFIRIFDEDHMKALSVVHDLKDLTDANSRWAFHCFLANNSGHPILVETEGVVTAVDGNTKTKYHEDCDLALSNEKFEITDTKTPLVVKPGESLHFALITNLKQREMKLGAATREAFERGDGLCHATVNTVNPWRGFEISLAIIQLN